MRKRSNIAVAPSEKNGSQATDRACLGELAQTLGLCGPELVHSPLEVLEVALDSVPLLHQEAVPLSVLLNVLRNLGTNQTTGGPTLSDHSAWPRKWSIRANGEGACGMMR